MLENVCMPQEPDIFLEQGPAELLRESMEAKGQLKLKEEQFEAERQPLARMDHVHRNAQLCALRRPLARRQPSLRLMKGVSCECFR
jgi:hypothetical protein